MSSPVIGDFCCCAGGASLGYSRAGFSLVGIDNRPQPHYPFEFHQADALTYPLDGFDAYRASPPCQNWSKASYQWRLSGKNYPDIISILRDRFTTTGRPFVIENVAGAPLINPVKLTGGMFGLNVLRDRYFECHGFSVPQPNFVAQPKPVKMGRPVRIGDIVQPVGHFSGVWYARQEMGLDWMNQYELSQALPWIYTFYIGVFMIGAL